MTQQEPLACLHPQYHPKERKEKKTLLFITGPGLPRVSKNPGKKKEKERNRDETFHKSNH